MKKEYINPQLEVVMMNNMPLLAGSGEGVQNGDSLGNQLKDEGAGLFAPSFDGGDSSEDW